MNKIKNTSEEKKHSDVLDDQYISDLLESTQKRRKKTPQRSTKKLERIVSSEVLFHIEIIIFLNKTRNELHSYGYYAEPLQRFNDSINSQ
jgi:hypothetical protein